MPLLLDLFVIIIIALCVWSGFRSGLIRGVFGIAGLIVAVIVANIVATAYAEEFSGMLKPFVGGVVETTITDIVDEGIDLDAVGGIDLEALGIDGIEGIGEFDITAIDPDDLPGGLSLQDIDYATIYTTLRQIGLPESPSSRIAEVVSEALEERFSVGVFAENITERLANTLSYIMLFGLTFLLISIIFAVIGNIVGLAFVLPGLRQLDAIGGAGLGLIKGLIIVFAISAVMRYLGLFISTTLHQTTILQFFVNRNPIANILGI